MPVDHAALRKAAKSATPGPWQATASGNVLSNVPDVDEFGPTAGRRCALRCTPTWYPDAAYIAAANPQTIIELLDEIERLRAAAN